jgi:peptidoglycan/xylan/chitin deacetylase (PgdA/CDA1 family)
VILIYHAVDEGPWGVRPDQFVAQLGWLQDHARVVSLDHLLAYPDEPGLRVALTFDDGYDSVYRTAAPLLAKRAMPATVYVNPNLMADEKRIASDPARGHYAARHFLLWPELHALAGAAWTIGSHGLDHVDLTGLSSAEQARQVGASREAIQGRGLGSCDHYCYAWGRHNPSARMAVRSAGYRSAAAGRHGPLMRDMDSFALPRVDVRASMDIEDFAAAVVGDWDYLGYVQAFRQVFS